jgi:5'-3' exonuclease
MTYLIDASIFIFRAWFSVPDTMTCPKDYPVNAVYGYTRFLSDFLETVQPDSVAAAFDESQAESLRCEIYPDYKANREPAPDELKRQFAQCRAVTRSLGISTCSSPRYEADDLIGTMAGRAQEAGRCVSILSRDKDLLQILQAGDVMWDFIGDRKIAHDDVPDIFGVRADQIVDYLALAGDSVDNIPGAPGVGPKTASALLQHFDSMDELFTNLDSVENVNVRGAAKLGAKLEAHREQVHMCRELTRIRYDVPLPGLDERLVREAPDLNDLTALYDEVGFGRSLRLQAQRIADSY